jgi:hypothetical protein
MAPKKGIEVNTDKKKTHNNGSSKMKKSGGVITSAAASAAARPLSTRPSTRPSATASARQPSAAARPSATASARQPSAAASARPLSTRPSARQPSAATSARPLSARPTTTRPLSARPTTVGPGTNRPPSTNYFTNTNNQLNNGDPPLPPGGGTDISFEFDCDNNETTKDMCKDRSDLEATSSRLQQIIQQVINELLAAPDALPPLNLLMTQILVSFVVDMIQNALQKEQKINPTDKNIDNLFKMASNIVLTSLVTTGQVPTASTIVIRVLVKRSMLDQKNAPSIPAMGKKLTLETLKQSKKILNKLDVFKPKIIEIIKNNKQQLNNPLTIQGIGGSRPKTRTGGRKSRRGN